MKVTQWHIHQRLEWKISCGYVGRRKLVKGKLNNIKYPCIQCKNKYCRGIFLKGYIDESAIEIANYMIEHNATVRQAAKNFGISKSTVHKDVTERLVQVNPTLAAQARKVIDVNKSERHIRGGLATKEKYAHQHAAS